MKCATHPAVDTNLACSKCGKPICPKCLVQTPVGARCRECARMEKPPTYAVPPSFYLRGGLAALVAGVGSGILWLVISSFMRFISFDILLAGAAGYVIAEAIGRATNHKRGTGLALMAAVGVLIAFTFSHGISWFLFPGFGLGFLFDVLAIILGIVIAVNRLR